MEFRYRSHRRLRSLGRIEQLACQFSASPGFHHLRQVSQHQDNSITTPDTGFSTGNIESKLIMACQYLTAVTASEPHTQPRQPGMGIMVNQVNQNHSRQQTHTLAQSQIVISRVRICTRSTTRSVFQCTLSPSPRLPNAFNPFVIANCLETNNACLVPTESQHIN